MSPSLLRSSHPCEVVGFNTGSCLLSLQLPLIDKKLSFEPVFSEFTELSAGWAGLAQLGKPPLFHFFWRGNVQTQWFHETPKSGSCITVLWGCNNLSLSGLPELPRPSFFVSLISNAMPCACARLPHVLKEKVVANSLVHVQVSRT